MDVQQTEATVDKWYMRLRKETATIFLALSIALNVWLNMKQQEARSDYRADIAAKDRIIAQKDSTIARKDAELKESNRERDVAQQKAIEAQAITIRLLSEKRPGSYPP